MRFEDFEYNDRNERWEYVYKNVPIYIYPSYDTFENPFNHELLVPVLSHRRYNFPSVIDVKEIKNRNDNEEDLFNDVIKTVKELYGEIVYGANIILGDHGGLWLTYGEPYVPPYSVGWDNSFIGWIFITKKSIKRWNPGIKRVTKKLVNKVINMWKTSIFPMLNDYVSGDIFDVAVQYPDDPLVYPSYGFEMDITLNQIAEEIDSYLEQKIQQYKKKRFDVLKRLIKNKVPLEIRQNKLGQIEKHYQPFISTFIEDKKAVNQMIVK